jgi:hypothetical protein
LSAIDNFAFNGTSIGYPLANFFALYALAVWSSTRGFIAGGVILAMVVFGAAVPAGTVAGSAEYLAVVVIVMMFVRRVVGDRERRAALAEASGTLLPARRFWTSERGSPASCTTPSRTTCR